MSQLTVHLKLPEDLSAKVRELAGKSDPKEVIIQILRSKLIPKFDIESYAKIPEELKAYPIWGSIPSEQK